MKVRSGEDVDETFEAFASRRRRVTMSLLSRRGPLSLSDLARAVSERECDVEARERIRTSLHHSHVPQLAAAGFVRYDRDAGVVAPTTRGESVYEIVERTVEELTDTGPKADGETDRDPTT